MIIWRILKMKNKELDFDIKIGLNKVEENITNLTDKERERVSVI